MVNQITHFFSELLRLFRELEQLIVDLAVMAVSWMAPVPTAYLIGRAVIVHLSFPLVVGLAAALSVELLGLSAGNTFLMLWSYNKRKRKSDPKAPAWIAGGLLVSYLVVAVLLTLLLDVIDGIARFSPVIFPLLSMTGVLLLSLRSDHNRRLRTIQQEKDEKRQNNGNNGKYAVTNHNYQNLDWRKISPEDRERVREMSTLEIAQTFGIPERTARNWRKLANN